MVFLAGALPDFWVGLILVFIFFATLGILPAPIGQLPGYIPSQIPTGPTNVDLLDTLIKGDFGQAGTAPSPRFDHARPDACHRLRAGWS